MAGAASQAGDADSSQAPGLTSGLQGSVNVHRGALLLVPQWQCISSFVFYIAVLLVLTQGYRYHKLRKHLKSSLDHTLTLNLSLVKYRVKNMFRKESSYQVLYDDLVKKTNEGQMRNEFRPRRTLKIVKRLRLRKYDPVIIERTIGLVLGPSTAFYRSFLKHCTPTNKALGDRRWHNFSKPPQRR